MSQNSVLLSCVLTVFTNIEMSGFTYPLMSFIDTTDAKPIHACDHERIAALVACASHAGIASNQYNKPCFINKDKGLFYPSSVPIKPTDKDMFDTLSANLPLYNLKDLMSDHELNTQVDEYFKLLHEASRRKVA